MMVLVRIGIRRFRGPSCLEPVYLRYPAALPTPIFSAAFFSRSSRVFTYVRVVCISACRANAFTS